MYRDPDRVSGRMLYPLSTKCRSLSTVNEHITRRTPVHCPSDHVPLCCSHVHIATVSSELKSSQEAPTSRRQLEKQLLHSGRTEEYAYKIMPP